MKKFLGFLLLLLSVFVGLYVGVYIMFIGGIVDIIDTLQSDTINSMNIALGILKIVFAGFTGGSSFVVLFVPAVEMMSSIKTRSKNVWR